MRLKNPYRVSAHAKVSAVIPSYGRSASSEIDEYQAGGSSHPKVENSHGLRAGEIPAVVTLKEEDVPSLTSLALALNRL